jgi:hypothetical protein
MLVRDEGVAGSNPATPTMTRINSRTTTADSRQKVAQRGPRTGRPALGPRLYLRKEKDGTKAWIIRDLNKDTRTGCREDDEFGAGLALEAYKMGEPIRTREDTIAGLVYFVTCTTSANYPIKIGWTKDMAKRMLGMQSGNPNVLTALVTTPGTYRDERKLHSLFRHLHIRGEWFRRGEDLLRYMATLPGYSEIYGADEFGSVPLPRTGTGETDG